MNESTAPRVVLPDASKRSGGEVVKAAPAGAWTLLAIAGWGFLLIGSMDVGLVWYPTAFGNGGWEFGSVTAALNGLPLPVMGLALVLAGAVAAGRPATARIVQLLSGLLLMAVAIMAVLYGLRVSEARAAVSAPLDVAGLQKAIVRSAAQLVIYTGVLVFLVRRATGLLKVGDRPWSAGA